MTMFSITLLSLVAVVVVEMVRVAVVLEVIAHRGTLKPLAVEDQVKRE